ncbi:hypothetical protein OQA88_3486 [Cercophora sp. LCS_1]
MGTLVVVSERNNRIIHSLLESTYDEAIDYQAVPWKSTFASNDQDKANFAALKKDYQTCLNADPSLGTQPLLDLIADLNSIWPFTSDAKAVIKESDYESIGRAIVYLQELGIDTFQTLKVGGDDLEPTIRTLTIAPPLIKYYQNATAYSDPEVVGPYAEAIALALADTFIGLNLTANDTNALADIATGIVAFEAEVASIFLQLEATEPSTDAINITLSDVPKLTSAPLSLDKVLAALLPPSYPATKRISFSTESFFSNYTDVLLTTPKSILQSYLLHKAITVFSPQVTPDSTSTPRWQFCLTHLNESHRWILSRFFASAVYPDTTRNYTDKMATTLRTQFKKRIDSLEWMSADAKARAKTKVDNIKQNIGYPVSSPDIRSPASLAEYYKGYNVTDAFFTNVLNSARHRTARTWDSILEKVDRGAYEHSKIQEANAAYVPWENTININAGISQLPFFSENLPAYATYGGLGSVVGHEILHGFDSNGRLYNEDAAKVSWWDEQTVKNFGDKSKCFVDQYGEMEYPVPGGMAKTDGELTLGENLSDAGGLRIAFDAWKGLEEKGQKLPGLDQFTREQLFFMFYANAWCNSYTPETNLESQGTDVHAHSSLRIRGAAANSRGFKEAFGCKVKEPECELF